jgi:hypothetical protein
VDAASPRYAAGEAEYHWYRIQPYIPDAAKRTLTVLTLEQAMFGTEIWINGSWVGGDIACYTSQRYDVSGLIRFGKTNEILVRVGNRSTLPPDSAVGHDQERETYIPGIWGDVYLECFGNPCITFVQTIPHLDRAVAELRVELENHSAEPMEVSLGTSVQEHTGGEVVSCEIALAATVAPGEATTFTFNHSLKSLHPWAPCSPFLYDVITTVRVAEKEIDRTMTTFGMREFTVEGSDFFLNGERIFLRGGNIAFHRFLSDSERSTLPWNREWITKALIDIPRQHNFNFFRNHLGQMYNLWYDIADEHGMLIQDEWQFWTTSGSREQVHREFRQWVRDNCNHPSIIIWDPINESTDQVVQQEIVPEMKRLDPSRPWESVDFVEQHPYIYSLCPVLIDRRFGFSDALDRIENSDRPSMVNEFLWWWLDRKGRPTVLMSGVIERWLGKTYSRKDLEQHQVFLATELVELFRRMRVDAIQPFVYLSNNNGPTAHWFQGQVADLKPKPLLAALRNAFSPFGVSVEMWDRHFLTGEQRKVRVFVLNDEPAPVAGSVVVGIRSPEGAWVSSTRVGVEVAGSGCTIVPVTVEFPAEEGSYGLCAELCDQDPYSSVAVSTKPAHVFSPPAVPPQLEQMHLGVFDRAGDTSEFLRGKGLRVTAFDGADPYSFDAILVAEGDVRGEHFRHEVATLSRYVESGHPLIILEPEWGVGERAFIHVLEGLDMIVEHRKDVDRGGYDSAVLAEDHTHPLWREIDREHLVFLNGSYGGEMVSEHDLRLSVPVRVHARSGLHLRTPVLMEVRHGSGRVFVSRLQVRGRLRASADTEGLYSRRPDPVAQQYLLNLLAWSLTDRFGFMKA